MKKFMFVVVLVLCLSASWLVGLAHAAAPAEVSAAASAYASNLEKGDLKASWQMLSSKSKAQVKEAQWEEAYRNRPASRPPSGSALLKALAQADPPAMIGDVKIDKGESLVAVNGTVQITQQLVLVKESGKWMVDIAATDELNAKQAAEDFLEAVRADSGAAPTPRPVRTASRNLPMLRVMLAPEAKNYQVADASVEGDRAVVTLACDLPVSLVLREVRSGPGWMVDVTRPMATTNPTSPDPLKEAAEASVATACQDQLRALARGMQMYLAASGDQFPDPDRWREQVQPFLPPGASLQCPSDKSITYVMNRNLAGKKRGELGNPAATVLLYEARLSSPNPSDTGEAWPVPPIHVTGNSVLYLDGNVKPMLSKPSFAVVAGTPRPIGAPSARPQPPRRHTPEGQGQTQRQAP